MTISKGDADTSIRRLIDQFKGVVAPHIEPGAPYALLDFPDHPNVGDSAIYTGEMEFFDAHVGRSPDYVCSLTTYDADVEAFCPEGPLFLHGGGNFGSVWQKHQRFREEIMSRYRDRKIVQMAQSIHFDDRTAEPLERTKRHIGDHPDFTLLVRDQQSYDFATAHFDCDVVKCPDAAHNMWKLDSDAKPDTKILNVLRADREAAYSEIHPYLTAKGPIVDWEPQVWARSPADRLVEKFIAPRLRSSNALMVRREKMYRRQAWYRVNYGVRLLSRGELIVSDRLHVHIMSSLMRKPHISLDNMYGKITRYVDLWGEDGLVTRVDGLDPLKAALDALEAA